MRIAELIAYHVRIPLRKPIKHASHSRTENDTLIVRCRLDDGREGWGEGLPRPYVTGETIETAFEQFGATDWRGQLGEAFEDLPGILAVCDAIAPIPPTGNGRRDCFGNSVRCAVELSILDAATRALELPLSAVTTSVPKTIAIRESRDEVRYSGVITSMGGLKKTVRAMLMRYYGFPDIKVKVGTAGTDDASSLALIRRVFGPNFDVRIDANEAWTCENLETKLQPLLPFRLSSLEQPVPHEHVDGLAEIRARVDVPIMLDESLCSLGDAHRAIERSTCDLFNIRLSKCGGFVRSLNLAALAHKAGLGYQLGCQVGETGILSAAGRHFATSVAGIRFLEGSYDRHLVRESLTEEDLTFRRGGRAPALSGPGLGVNIDETAVARVTIRQESRRIM